MQGVSKLVLIATSARGDSDLQAQRKAAGAQADPAALAANQAMFRWDGDLEKLLFIARPTLIVAGSKDRLRSLEAAEMEVAIPDARMTIIEAGHMIPMEARAELSSLLTAFLSA